MYIKIIFSSFKESFVKIFKNKTLFFLLLALQIVFFVIFFLISSVYVPRMQEHARGMYDYMSKNFNDESMTQNILQQQNILGENPLSLSRNLGEVTKNSKAYLFYSFILLAFFIPAAWSVANNLAHKRTFKKSLKVFYRMLVIAFFYLGIIFMLFYSLLNISFTEAAFNSAKILGKYLLFFLISAVLFYFMFISISLADGTKLKDIVQKTLSIGIRKAHYMLSAYFVNIFFKILPLFLIIYFIDINFFIVALAIILFVFSFLFSRIFILSVVEKLEQFD